MSLMKNIVTKCNLLIFFVLILILSCSKPLPPEKNNYVGEWRGMGMYLLILQDGSVKYERVKGGGNVSINAPLKAFDGDDFIVGVAFMTTTFDVTVPPHEVGGVWKMVVDGVELTRSRY